MKRIIIIGLLSATLSLFGTTALAIHGIIPATHKVSYILINLKKMGYHNFQKIDFLHGIYHVHAIDSNGQIVIIYVDPEETPGTAPFLPPEKTNALTMLQAIQKLEKAGYKNIDQVYYQYGRYRVKSFDKFKHRITLYIDPKTGKIARY